MGNLTQPPTYAPLTVQGPDGSQNAINPVWLQWFLQYGAQSNYTNTITPANTQWSYASGGVVNTEFDFTNNTSTPLAVLVQTPNPSALTFQTQYYVGRTGHIIVQSLPTTCIFIVMFPSDILKIGATANYAGALIYRPL